MKSWSSEQDHLDPDIIKIEDCNKIFYKANRIWNYVITIVSRSTMSGYT